MNSTRTLFLLVAVALSIGLAALALACVCGAPGYPGPRRFDPTTLDASSYPGF